jgi:hypothetical protein
MQYGSRSSIAIGTARVFAATLLFSLALAATATVATQTAIPVAPFSSRRGDVHCRLNVAVNMLPGSCWMTRTSFPLSRITK